MNIFNKLIELCELIMKNPLKGILCIIVLILIAFIICVVIYRKSKWVQLCINVMENLFFPIIKKDRVIMVVFTKHKAVVRNVLGQYSLVGYKKIKSEYLEVFNNNIKINEEKIQKIVNAQCKKMCKVKRGIKRNNSLVYLGFPHVPIAFLDGINFSGTDNVTLYEYKSGHANSSENNFFELKKIYNSNFVILSNYENLKINEKEIILKIEQSFPISDEEIKQVVGELPIVYLKNENIKRWGIESYSDVDKYVKEFSKVLSWAKSKGIRKIHLVATTPVSLTFSLGRVIEHYHPEVIVYNYNNNKYDWCVDIKNKKVNMI